MIAVFPQPAELRGEILRIGDDIIGFQGTVGIPGQQMMIHQHRYRLSRGYCRGAPYLIMARLTAGKHQQTEHQDCENAAAQRF